MNATVETTETNSGIAPVEQSQQPLESNEAQSSQRSLGEAQSTERIAVANTQTQPSRVIRPVGAEALLPGEIYLANESRFNAAFFSEPLI